MSNGDSNDSGFRQTTNFGLRKSEFTAKTTIASSATFDYVENGTNIKITFDDLVNNLGVTGTIVPTTESGTTPVLDVAGSVNTIRNLSPGSGIGLALTAFNSIEISQNFDVDTEGAPVFNEATDPTTVRSLVAGDGIALGIATGTVQITATGAAPVTGKTVQINSMSDFPAPVAGVITLSGDTFYSINNDLSTADRFIMGDKTKLGAVGSSIITFAYTGTGIMFTASDASCTLEGMTIDCSSGTLYDWENTAGNEGTDTFVITGCTILCDVMGDFDSGSFLFMEDSQIITTTNGMTITGTNISNILFTTMSFDMTLGTAIDFGSTVITSIRMATMQFTLAAGTTGISGLVASGNIASGGLGRIGATSFFGAGTALNNILGSDDRWSINNCFPVQNSRTDALIFMNGNATETVIVATNTPVLVAGTFTEQIASRMTTTAAGRITYNPTSPENLPITVTILMGKSGGSGDDLAAYVYFNGSQVVATETKVVNTQDPPETSITISWQETFNPTDFIEIFVENQDTTNNIVVVNITIRVN